jgi:hypothetical protein
MTRIFLLLIGWNEGTVDTNEVIAPLEYIDDWRLGRSFGQTKINSHVHP